MLQRFALAGLVLLAGCGQVGPTTVAVRPPPAAPQASSVTGITIADDFVRERLAALETASRQLAAERRWTYAVSPPAGYRDGIERLAGFASSKPVSPDAEWMELSSVRPVQSIRLLAVADGSNAHEKGSLGLTASAYSQAGWSVRLGYFVQSDGSRSLGRDRESFSLSFYHDDPTLQKWRGQPLPAVSFPVPDYSRHFSQGAVSYNIHVPIRDDSSPERRRADESAAELRSCFESAERFRTAALEQLDALEARARATIPTGDAIVSYWDYTGHSGGDPPMEQFGPPTDSRYILTPAAAQGLLDEALADIERRRQLVKDSYQQMHAVSQEAFPLGKFLAGNPAPPTKD